MKRIQEINSEITNFVKELERELDKEFRETFRFFDSLFDVQLIIANNEITSIFVSICEFNETTRYHLNTDGIWSYEDRIINDYAEVVLKVLNRVK